MSERGSGPPDQDNTTGLDASDTSDVSYTEHEDPLIDAPENSSPIFAQKKLLEIGHVPDVDRIVGRDNEIRQVAQRVKNLSHGTSPTSFIIYGKTGTGKTLVARHVATRVKQAGPRHDTNVATAYVDCSQDSTPTQAARSIAREINEPAETGFNIPITGMGMSQYLLRLWQTLDQLYDSLLVILDEVDRLRGTDPAENDDDLLMQLSRAREAQKTDARIGIIGISNKISYRDRLNQRVKSSFGTNDFVFSPYDQDQLTSILEARRDAFRPDVLSTGVLPKTAALSSREHGDARRAVRILRHAGEVAEQEHAEQITEAHVDQARERAEVDRVAELVSTLPPHSRYILHALVALSEQNRPNEFKTALVHNVYEKVCDREGATPLSLSRFREILDELAFLELTEKKHTGGGKNQGAFNVHKLLYDADVIKSYLLNRTNIETRQGLLE